MLIRIIYLCIYVRISPPLYTVGLLNYLFPPLRASLLGAALATSRPPPSHFIWDRKAAKVHGDMGNASERRGKVKPTETAVCK